MYFEGGEGDLRAAEEASNRNLLALLRSRLGPDAVFRWGLHASRVVPATSTSLTLVSRGYAQPCDAAASVIRRSLACGRASWRPSARCWAARTRSRCCPRQGRHSSPHGLLILHMCTLVAPAALGVASKMLD